MKYIGKYTDEKYGTLPLYELTGFINTREGWNMRAAVQRGEISSEEYEAAKKAYNKKEPNASPTKAER